MLNLDVIYFDGESTHQALFQLMKIYYSVPGGAGDIGEIRIGLWNNENQDFFNKNKEGYYIGKGYSYLKFINCAK